MLEGRRVMVSLSGGLDSCVLAAYAKLHGAAVETVSVHYGQRHKRELMAATQIAARLHIPNHRVDLGALGSALGGSSQTDSGVPVPHGHYTDESMKATVVPNRNMILLAVAGGIAISRGFDTLAYAAHAGDHAIYPDCRPEFFEQLAKAFLQCDWKPVDLVAPFGRMTKADIAKLGAEIGAPLGLTYSCYEGEIAHCGKCGTCIERREAFELAGVLDETRYADAA